MSQENVELVLAQHEAIERHDWPAALAFHAEGMTLVVDPSVAPNPGVYVGSEAGK